MTEEDETFIDDMGQLLEEYQEHSQQRRKISTLYAMEERVLEERQRLEAAQPGGKP